MGIADERAEKYIVTLQKYIEHVFNRALKRRKWVERTEQMYSNGHLGWLESFCVGRGFNMGCGDMPVKDSIGVDVALTLGSFNGAPFCSMDDMWHFQSDSADYIISNYIEAASTPCKLFSEWYRLLKPGGVVAILCVDADDVAYDNTSSGPLSRSRSGGIKKHCCYTPRTLRFHLQFVGFTVDYIEKEGPVLKVVAHK